VTPRDRQVQQPSSVTLPIRDRALVMRDFDALPWPLREAISNTRLEYVSVHMVRAAFEHSPDRIGDLVSLIRECDETEVRVDAWVHYGPDHPAAGKRPSVLELYLYGYADKADQLEQAAHAEGRDLDLYASEEDEELDEETARAVLARDGVEERRRENLDQLGARVMTRRSDS
jgi:hypothetical protein